MRSRLLLGCAAAILSSWLGGCCAFWDVGPFPGPPLPTVDGPEDPSVLVGTHGTLVVLDREDPAHLTLVSMPSLERARVSVASRVFCVSGPDDQGRIAYVAVEDRWKQERYALRIMSIEDGSDRLLFQRDGPLNPTAQVALSPAGGRIAFTSSIDRSHGYDYSPWVLEVIDIASGRIMQIDGAIEQHHPLWLPDGRHLAFAEWRAEDRTITTSIVDVQSGERRVVREGKQRSMVRGVSLDAPALLFGEGEYLERVDAMKSNVLEDQLRLPGNLLVRADPTNSWTVVADLGAGKFIYDARPTTGVKQEVRHEYIWPNDLKLGEVGSGSFVTVVSRLWGEASYGSFDLPTATEQR